MSELNKTRAAARPSNREKSRFNAWRHGLTGKTVVLPWQDHQAYKAFCQNLIADLKPVGAVEEQFAQTFIDCSWRLNTAAAHETNLFSLAADNSVIDCGDQRVNDAFAEANLLRLESQTFANISLYCHRLARQREKALAQLQALQKAREAARKQALEEAAALRKLHTVKQIPFNPADFDFVFSKSEIDLYIRREALRQEAKTPPQPTRISRAA